MRANAFSKILFYFSLFAVVLFIVSMTITNLDIKNGFAVLNSRLMKNTFSAHNLRKNRFRSVDNQSLIFILEWTSPNTEPFLFLGTEQQGFVQRRCKYKNCFVTHDKYLLGDLNEFDVILFHGPELKKMPNRLLPQERSPHQKYVFASMESSHYYPVCSTRLDGFFNWTWTYRLDSDARWGYMSVLDRNKKNIGPNKVMHWMRLEDMDPVSESFKDKLKSKTRSAAWFVSNCRDRSGRKRFADELKVELAEYNLALDVYGTCGTLSCPRTSKEHCGDLVDEFYYFYLAFENSFSEDYVTEKLLIPLQHNAVPIVYGGANYSRFLPDGSYLNAKKLGAKKLAATMYRLISEPDEYADYFRWQNHYSYHSREEDTPEINEYCGFCALLNDKKKMKETTIIKNFKEWWDNPNFCD